MCWKNYQLNYFSRNMDYRIYGFQICMPSDCIKKLLLLAMSRLTSDMDLIKIV